MNPFKKLLKSAKCKEEEVGIAKMISMMLCLRKHDKVKSREKNAGILWDVDREKLIEDLREAGFNVIKKEDKK